MSLAMSVTLDERDMRTIELFIKKFPNVIDRSVKQATAKGKGLIIRSTPVGRSGGVGLRPSWDSRKIKQFVYEIFNPKKYAQYVETGTGKHRPGGTIIQSKKISPRTGRRLMLRWTPVIKNVPGEMVFRPFTKGMKAQPMIKPNIGPITKILTERVQVNVRKEWSKK